MELFSLEGKVALVTGGSRGIGEVTAIGLARAGADVVVSSRKLADLEKVVETIRGLGRKSLAVAAHMGHMAEIKSLVERVKAEFGRIDILVNNAAANPAMAEVIDAEERLWDTIMNANLKGLFFLSQAVARVMREHGGGSIINVSSAGGLKPDFKLGIYSISKAGVIMATQVMAVEWAQYGIRVNAVAPGTIHTRTGDSRFALFPELEKAKIARTPMGRIGNPEELVGTMIYLASDASSFTTGATILVDGGKCLT